ncbi:MAG: hypothetical protein WC397_04485 [Candidatus Paceibacterota bacterium]|jgi:hypothetical protein
MNNKLFYVYGVLVAFVFSYYIPSWTIVPETDAATDAAALTDCAKDLGADCDENVTIYTVENGKVVSKTSGQQQSSVTVSQPVVEETSLKVFINDHVACFQENGSWADCAD